MYEQWKEKETTEIQKLENKAASLKKDSAEARIVFFVLGAYIIGDKNCIWI